MYTDFQTDLLSYHIVHVEFFFFALAVYKEELKAQNKILHVNN